MNDTPYKSSIRSFCFSLALIFPPAYADARTLIQNKGSDTLANAVQALSEEFHRLHPDMGVAVNAGGSGTGIAALINGTADIANSSRAMRDAEMALATQHGRKPVAHIVGYDAVAVFVHPDNPVETLSLSQLGEIYGENGTLESWTDLGIEIPGCQDQKIVRVGRQNSSGTFAYFRRAALGSDRDYKLGTRAMGASRHVLDLVAETPCAVGYSSLAFSTPAVKTLCLASAEDAPCVTPEIESIVESQYPIKRPLYMYTDGDPVGAIGTYLDWVLGDAGQCIIQGRGYGSVRPVKCTE